MAGGPGHGSWGRRWLRGCGLASPFAAKAARLSVPYAVTGLMVLPGVVFGEARVRGGRGRMPTILARPLLPQVLNERVGRFGSDGHPWGPAGAAGLCRRLERALGNDFFAFPELPLVRCPCNPGPRNVLCEHSVALILAFVEAADEDPSVLLAFRVKGWSPVARRRPVVGARGPAVPAPPRRLPVRRSPPRFRAPAAPPADPVLVAAVAAALAGARDPAARSPLGRIATPDFWQPDDPDLARVTDALLAALATVRDDRDLEADIACALGAAAASSAAAASILPVPTEPGMEDGSFEAPSAAGAADAYRAAAQGSTVGGDRPRARSGRGRSASPPAGGPPVRRRAPGPRRAGATARGGGVAMAAQRTCAVCTHPLQPHWRYCSACGARVPWRGGGDPWPDPERGRRRSE